MKVVECSYNNMRIAFEISFHFILKFFREGNPSAKMLVFKSPSSIWDYLYLNMLHQDLEFLCI